MGKKPLNDNSDSEIREQFTRLAQNDEYFALYDLLDSYNWSPNVARKIEQLIEHGFFKGEVLPISSKEVTLLDQALGQIDVSDKWARHYQILKKLHNGRLNGLSSATFSIVINIRRAIKKEKRLISKMERSSLQKIRDSLARKSQHSITELDWICKNLNRLLNRFIKSKAYSDFGSALLFTKDDRTDLIQEVLIKLIRRGDYDHTLPRAAKIDYLESILDSLIKDSRRASLPGGVEISNGYSRNIFLIDAQQHQSESNSMRAKRKKPA